MTLRQVCDENPAPPRSLNPAISKDLETICLKCLQKEPARRYQTAEALANDFRHLLQGEPIDARPVGSLIRIKLWAKRNPLIAALSLTVYVLLAMLAVGLTMLVVKQNEALRITNQSLVREYLGKALPIAEGSRTSDALPWLAAAIELEDQAGVLSEASQTRLAAILRQSPKPSRIWAGEGPIREGVLSPSGTLVATVSGNVAEVWHVAEDEPIPGGPLRFASGINRLLFSPDERFVAAALWNGEVHIAEISNCVIFNKIKVSGAEVSQILFSPSGKEIAASSESVAGVWLVETGQPLSIKLKHRDRVNALAFSPMGKTLAVAVGGPNLGEVGEVVLWDLSPTPAGPIVLPHGDDVNAIAFSGDGKTMVSGSYDHFVRVWDTSSGKPIRQWELKDSVGHLVLSRDGRRIAAATGDLLYLFEVDASQPTEPLKHPGTLLQVKFFDDGQKVAAACDDWTTRVWNFTTKDLALPALVHAARINSIDITADGRHLLTASEDRTARLWDLACGQGAKLSVVLQAGTSEPLLDAIGSRDGRRFLVVGSEGTARVFDTETGAPIAPPVKVAGFARRAAFHPDGRLFGVIDSSGKAAIWDAETGERVFDIPAEEGAIVAIRFSADGARLVTAGNPTNKGNQSAGGAITVHDTKTGSVLLGPIQADWPIAGLVIDPGLTAIASCDKQGTVQLWNGGNGERISKPIGNSGGILDAAFSPDGRFLATAGVSGKGIIWNVSTRSRHGQPLVHDQEINQIAFSPDGRFVATAGKDRYATIWDVETTELRGRPMAHAHEVSSVSFTKDGRFLVTGSGSELTGAEGESIVWETSTGYPVNKGITHRTRNVFSRCLEDGETFLTISKNDPAASLWQLPKMETSRADLLTMAAIVSGLIKTAETDTLAPVPAKNLADLHREFRRRNAKAFHPTRDDLLRWHDAEAVGCDAMDLNERSLVHLNALVEAQPNGRNGLARRGKVLAELGRWSDALRDFERAASDGSGDLMEVWYPLQILRVHQGAISDFRSSCEALEKHYGPSSPYWERNNLAYICSLASDALRDYQRLLIMTDLNDKDLARMEAFHDTRAAVLYRVKHYNDALAILESLGTKSRTEAPDAGVLARDMLLAMTYARLDRRVEAHELFSKVEPKVKEILQTNSSNNLHWHESLHLEVLLRETREAVGP